MGTKIRINIKLSHTKLIKRQSKGEQKKKIVIDTVDEILKILHYFLHHKLHSEYTFMFGKVHYILMCNMKHDHQNDLFKILTKISARITLNTFVIVRNKKTQIVFRMLTNVVFVTCRRKT